MSVNSLSIILNNPSHHAFLVLGDEEQNYEELRLMVRKKIVANELEAVDAWSQKYENIGIDDTREIKQIQNTKPIGNKRVISLSLLSIQIEAQNALLKLFESPSSDTVFFIFVRSPEIFLPTLLSRFHIVDLRNIDSLSTKSEIKKFVYNNIKNRLGFVEAIIKNKDKAAVETFLNDLEFELRFENGNKSIPNNVHIFETIFSARRFIRERSSSIKMILENICVSVPMLEKK